jgi:transcriptional regulator with XRE-family HTH domain
MSKRDPILAKPGLNIRKQREAGGYTQEKLSERSGLDPTHISDIERGLCNPGIKNMARLAKALGLTTAELYKGVDAPPYRVGTRSTASQTSEEKSGTLWKASLPLRFIDLFCGIGGFRIAFERAGGQYVFSSDWNEMAQITYEANFHERPHGDIYSVPDNTIPPHNILCAGFAWRRRTSRRFTRRWRRWRCEEELGTSNIQSAFIISG